MTERNLFKEPLSAAEITTLARRAGGAREMVAPTRRAEIEGLTDTQVVAYLAEDPRRLRRPIIDTGDQVHLGFSKRVREALS